MRSAVTPPFRSGTIPCCGANNTRAAGVMCNNALFYRYGIPDGIRWWCAYVMPHGWRAHTFPQGDALGYQAQQTYGLHIMATCNLMAISAR